VLALFEHVRDALSMQEEVYRTLPTGAVELDEYQVVVNAKDEVMGFNSRLLIGSTGLRLTELVDTIRERGGLIVASHVDRGAFSIASQLGFAPQELRFDAFEVIDPGKAEPALLFHPRVPRVRFSDSHRLEDIGSRTTEFHMESPTFEEVSMALGGRDGRSVRQGA
jgi:hypothetical protein